MAYKERDYAAIGSSLSPELQTNLAARSYPKYFSSDEHHIHSHKPEYGSPRNTNVVYINRDGFPLLWCYRLLIFL
jgi:hypothetical protein